jgi:L-threonylcarbamoyladenylate synthase
MPIIHASELNQKKIQELIHTTIKSGGLCVFPTETVYGIGADATQDEAVKKIFIAKGRPSDNPLIVHLSSKKDLTQCVREIPEIAYPLMDEFWPGPLTLVFKKSPSISPLVTGGLDTVGIRIPSSILAQQVIQAAGVPLCAPSANISGKPSATLFSHVLDDFKDRVDLLIDGGKVTIGLESTVLDLTTPIPTLLRPGAITQKMIEDVLKVSILDATKDYIEGIPKSPGMKYKHYAPSGELSLVKGDFNQVIQYLTDAIVKNENIGIIAPKEYIDKLKGKHLLSMGSILDPNEIGSNLFSALRTMDQQHIQTIYIPVLDDQDLGQAIMNRLLKAASYRIIDLSEAR